MQFPLSSPLVATCAAVLALAMAGCASMTPRRDMSLSGNEPAVKFNTGRVSLTVTDWGGRPLAQARVDLESVGNGDYFRTAAMSDVFGRVSFAGVPEQVRISVYHAQTQANYSRQFDVPSSGTTELRMMMETVP
jgi:hypothetical protein